MSDDKKGLVGDWVDREIEHVCDMINGLRSRPPTERVTCMTCGGTANPQCGCDGTMTVQDAIAYLEGELEILCYK